MEVMHETHGTITEVVILRLFYYYIIMLYNMKKTCVMCTVLSFGSLKTTNTINPRFPISL